MAGMMDMIVKIFALVGILAVTGIVLYYIAKALEGYTPPPPKLWPDQEYMEKVGGPCPTGWVYTGSTGGKDTCVNKFNVPVNPDITQNCYDKDSETTKSFSTISNWDDCANDPYNCKNLQERCGWIKKCGINGAYAPWIGVADKC